MPGIPAILLLIPVLGCLARIPLLDVDDQVVSYELAIWEAIKNEEFELANFYYRKLYQVGYLVGSG